MAVLMGHNVYEGSYWAITAAQSHQYIQKLNEDPKEVARFFTLNYYEASTTTGSKSKLTA
jgi:hypothetical protein